MYGKRVLVAVVGMAQNKRYTYKYPSCDSFVSDGVGEGEMTLGVPGTEAVERRDILKGGSDGL